MYSVTKVKILEPEFYMVYTGEGYEDVEYISLAEHFFGKPVGANDSNIDLKVKVIRQNDNDNSILDQYIKFSKVYDKYRKEETDIIEVIKATIDECIAKGILSDYLNRHRNEVYTMITELYEQELATKSYGDERELKGKIEVYYSELEWTIEQIAEKLKITIEQVQEIINNL